MALQSQAETAVKKIALAGCDLVTGKWNISVKQL